MVRHVIDSRQFSLEFLNRLFARTDELLLYNARGSPFPDYRGRRMVQFYWQPSTRTADSFNTAAIKLGIATEYYSNAGDFSSFAKGESLEHGIQAIGNNYDILVIRHGRPGAPYIAALISGRPVINAGDGSNQHPTQALLDTYTIYDRLEKLDDLDVVIVGECDGRVTRSLAYLLAKHGRKNRFYFVAPKEFQADDEFLEYLKDKGVKVEKLDDLDQVTDVGDVFYSTRLRKERLEEIRIKEMEEKLDKKLDDDEKKEAKKLAEEDYKKLRERAYPMTVIDERRASRMKKDAVIMHPLPIDTESGYPEITLEVDNNSRQSYLEASTKGWAIRTALLEALLIDNEVAEELEEPNYDKIWRDVFNGKERYSPETLRNMVRWRERSEHETLRRLDARKQKRLEAARIIMN